MSVKRDIVTIGASAGGVEAITRLARLLPADLPASIFVVVHISPSGTSVLPEILRRAGPLPAAHAVDGEPIYPGRIYVALPDRHMLLYPGRIQLSSGPREKRNRPAIDPLFRSAARAYGARVLGIVLSGTLDDGVAGLGIVRREGGATMTQDPDEAGFPGMPEAAIASGNVERVARLAEIAAAIDAASRSGASAGSPAEAPIDPVEELRGGRSRR